MLNKKFYLDIHRNPIIEQDYEIFLSKASQV